MNHPPPVPPRKHFSAPPDLVALISDFSLEERENAAKLLLLYTSLSPENRKLILTIAHNLPKEVREIHG